VDSLLATIRTLEQELHDPRVRRNRSRLLELIHPDFQEVGQSGRSYDRDAIIRELIDEANDTVVHSDSYVISELVDGIALLRYVSSVDAQNGPHARRCQRVSIWQRCDCGWRIIYHQGTPIR
jgi:hypothetical protein